MAKKKRLVKDLTRVGQRVRAQRKKSGSPLWRRKAHAMWSLIIRRRAGACEICGVTTKDKILNAHHLLSKEKYQHLAYTLLNGFCTCQNCHAIDKFSCHMNPVWFTMWLRTFRPHVYTWVIQHVMEPTVYITDFKVEYERLRKIAEAEGFIERKTV